ncbi:hypothetical protein TNCV_2283311 [Trichonephila clavipes]|nr:hypothetical protein TNCV_2283311 [Trichonephila clavipes]
MLPVLGKKAVLEWCMKEGFIGSSYVCPKCGKSMGKKERAVGSLVVRASDSRPEGLGSMPDATKHPPCTHGVRAR